MGCPSATREARTTVGCVRTRAQERGMCRGSNTGPRALRERAGDCVGTPATHLRGQVVGFTTRCIHRSQVYVPCVSVSVMRP
jgi:hypothetical protein